MKLFSKEEKMDKSPNPLSESDNKSGYSAMMAQAISDYERSIATIIFLCIKNLEFELGAKKLTQVLTGKQTKFITDHHIQKNPAFSLLKQFSSRDLKAIIEILEATGYLRKQNVKWDIDVLCLTDRADAVLRGEEEFEASFIDPLSENDFIELDNNQEKLYEILRRLRYSLATDNGLPAYTVCHDRALRLMAVNKPHTIDELLALKGIGKTFVDKYSDEFLAIIDEYSIEGETKDDPQIEVTEEGTAEAVVNDDTANEMTCKKCMLYRADECIGEREICEFFRPSPDIPPEIIETWPTEMGGPYGTLHNDRR